MPSVSLVAGDLPALPASTKQGESMNARKIAAAFALPIAALGITTPTATADVRAGVVINYSGYADYPYMLVDPDGGSHNNAIKLQKGQSYKVPSSRTGTLVVQIVGDSWKQRWLPGEYGACHSTGDNYSSSWFKPNHAITTQVRFISYMGSSSC